MAYKGYIDKDVYTLAKERIRHAYTLYDSIVVSFSGGKDSTACLQLTLEVAHELGKTPVEAIFFDEECIPYQTEDYVRRISKRDDVNLKWLCNVQKTRNGCSHDEPYMYLWDEAKRDVWGRPMPPEAITHMQMNGLVHHEMVPYYYPPSEYGVVGMILGIRADESLSRYRAVTAKTGDQENYITKYNEDLLYCGLCKKRMVRGVSKRVKKDGKIIHIHDDSFHTCNDAPQAFNNLYKVMPIYDWTDDDIWTAPRDLGWDYNEAYDVMEMAGLPRGHQRCSPAFGNEALQKLWTYNICFPEIWEKMIYRVKGANTALRYAMTPLYGHKISAEKPDNMTWEQYIELILKRIKDQDIRTKTANRIASMIRSHFKKTTEGIAPNAPHPKTGVSWDYLALIAIRTDLQQRKQPGSRVDNDRIKEMYERYNKEMKLVKEGELS